MSDQSISDAARKLAEELWRANAEKGSWVDAAPYFQAAIDAAAAEAIELCAAEWDKWIHEDNNELKDRVFFSDVLRALAAPRPKEGHD